MISQLKFAALLISLFGVLTVSAHQQKESITRVEFNERTGKLEVMHRFSIHDVEHASRLLFDKSVNVLVSADDRQLFADYAHNTFSIADQTGVALALQPVGHEIEGRFLWVYAEADMPKKLLKLTVYNGALHEIWATQSNLVNVKLGKRIKSATFVRGSRPTVITL
ncbi:MAG: DUF6702 family protein [Gammaproteobacteria bacterium]